MEVRNRAAEAVVIEPEFKKLRQAGERFGDRPREAVVGEVELLEPAHALEGSVSLGYVSRELVPRQVDRSQALQLAYRRHRVIEAVPHEAEGADSRQAAEKGGWERDPERVMSSRRRPETSPPSPQRTPAQFVRLLWQGAGQAASQVLRAPVASEMVALNWRRTSASDEPAEEEGGCGCEEEQQRHEEGEGPP